MGAKDREGLSPEYLAKLARRARRAANKCLPALREVAQAHGYALGLHGSVARDVDLIAVPWVDEAAPAIELVRAAAARIRELCGWVHCPAVDLDKPTFKPHGRLAWSIHIQGGVYFDVSVLPRAPDA